MTKNSSKESLEVKLQRKTSECDAAQRKIMSLKRELNRTESAFNSAVDTINEQAKKIELLEARLNTPELLSFADGVVSEAQHQRARWGPEHDQTKTNADWFWTLGYLSQKAMTAADLGHLDKALHHCISSAALLANWHAFLLSRLNESD